MTTGLVLQGGGALGAFELGVIECLLDNGIAPDVVSGVSIGAINATVLAGSKGPDPRQELRGLWDDLTTMALPPPLDASNGDVALFGNPGMYAPRIDYLNLWHWTSIYETSRLRATLAKHVDFTKLQPTNFGRPADQQAPRLILTATNLVSGKLDRFDSKEMALTAEHVAASGSLPPSFPMTSAPSPTAAGRPMPYWDGGLFDNTPLSKVISALEEGDAQEKTMYVVNLFPSSAPLPRNFAEVANRMMTLAFSNKTEKDLQRAKQTTEIIKLVDELDRLMPSHPELLPLRELEGYKVVKALNKPIDIIEITNDDVTGPHDFSPDAIDERRLRGYAAAQEALTSHGRGASAQPAPKGDGRRLAGGTDAQPRGTDGSAHHVHPEAGLGGRHRGRPQRDRHR
jgi:predicted acylesterase/phospholipase RssA